MRAHRSSVSRSLGRLGVALGLCTMCALAGSAPASAQLDSTQLDSTRLNSTQLDSTQADSTTAAQSLSLPRQLFVVSTYAALYGIATHVGSRRRVDDRFKVVRLETAYFYDSVGHAFLVRELGGLAAAGQRLAGVEPHQARTNGVWWAAFGAELYMEILNGWVHNVRFDPMDPVANLAGALMATKGSDLAAAHPWIDRFSLQFGYKDWGRAFRPAKHDDATLGSIWHDHANGRFGLGYDIGPLRCPWITVFLSYEITSLQLENLKNRFGVGIELQPVNWLSPLIRELPLGHQFLSAYDWLNQRVLMPGLYLQLFHVDAGAFSNREPFQE